MNEKPRYYDKRSGFWRGHFEAAQGWDAYLAGSDPEQAAKWRDVMGQLPVLDPAVAAALAAFYRQLNVLVYSGVWCGDCSRQGPMLTTRALQEPAPSGTDLRLRLGDIELF